uniref:START domain-containing protein n=1 Tax=Micromonas pusilla TaxID=38833 RepID=A0A7R9XU40_MICPS
MFEHGDICASVETELAHVSRVDEVERDIVTKFFGMLTSKEWKHSTTSNGTDIFKLPGERIHRIMGVTRTEASPEEVLGFFSDPQNFKKHFTILDDMFKEGSVVKIGGQGLGLDATGERLHKLGKFAALSIGGKERVGPTDPKEFAVSLLNKIRRSPGGQKIEGLIKKHAGDKGAVAALGELPSSQTSALAQTSIRAEFKDGQFKDLPGHALLHGTFRLPSIVPDRDFVWDQVAMRLPTGSVLVMGQSVNDGDEDVPECVKGHVRGAVLTSGYYVFEDGQGGSKIAFVLQADPKGSLPAWVVNLVAPKQAHNVTRLRKYLDSTVGSSVSRA